MKVKINFTGNYIKYLIRQDFYDNLTDITEIDWQLPFLPRIGETFDWFEFLDKKILDNIFSPAELETLHDAAWDAKVNHICWHKNESTGKTIVEFMLINDSVDE